jgi:hypothetical protein
LHSLSFRFPYQPGKNYRFLPYKELKNYAGKASEKYVLINPAKIKFANHYYYFVPNEVLAPPITWKLLIQKGDLKVYQIFDDAENKL